ncbi:hypothetical protein ARSEF4850_000979 [Beauveria asiatica]
MENTLRQPDFIQIATEQMETMTQRLETITQRLETITQRLDLIQETMQRGFTDMRQTMKIMNKNTTAKMQNGRVMHRGIPLRPLYDESSGEVIPGCPNSLEALDALSDIAEHYLRASDRASLPKILQFSSEDRMTKYEMCQKFADIMGLPLDNIEPDTKGNDPNASVKRPYDTHLSTKALKSLDINLSVCDFTAWWRRELGAFRK